MIFKKNMGLCCLPLQGLEHDKKLIESEFQWGKIELLPILSQHLVQAAQIRVQFSCETEHLRLNLATKAQLRCPPPQLTHINCSSRLGQVKGKLILGRAIMWPLVQKVLSSEPTCWPNRPLVTQQGELGFGKATREMIECVKKLWRMDRVGILWSF